MALTQVSSDVLNTTQGNLNLISLGVSGDLTFTGNGSRILGDFNNLTSFASRPLFQSNTANSNTNLGVIPSGTANVTRLYLHAGSDPDNTNAVLVQSDSSRGAIGTFAYGTGTQVPFKIYSGGSQVIEITTDGNVGIGTDTPTAKLHVAGNVTVSGNVSAPNFSGTANNASYLGGAPAASYAQTSTVIGVNQTWQNVSGSRSSGVTYTNSTGKPIFISVRWERDDGTLELTVDGLLIGRTGQTAGPVLYTLTAIVPAGSTYSATATGSGGTLFWYELR